MSMDEQLKQHYQGHLVKFTNVVKGWQTRWFVLNPELGTLQYYLSESDMGLRARGSIQLAGAVISPSDEDCYTFTVSPAIGESYKLRAQDTRDRQMWLNRLRVIAEMHTKAFAHHHSAFSSSRGIVPPTVAGSGSGVTVHSSHSMAAAAPTGTSTLSHAATSQAGVLCGAVSSISSLAVLDAFTQVSELLSTAYSQNMALAEAIEGLPMHGRGVKCYDANLLLLKATSHATVLCLDSCLSVLKTQQQQASALRPRQNSPSLHPSSPSLRSRKPRHNVTPLQQLPSKAPSHITQQLLTLEPNNEEMTIETVISDTSARKEGGLSDCREEISAQEELAAPVSVRQGNTAQRKSKFFLTLGAPETSEQIVGSPYDGFLTTLPTIPTNFALNSNRFIVWHSTDAEESDDDTPISSDDSSGCKNSEQQHSVIMHIIAQLRLGMDLTRVTLPTFILEQRSLLEMFADFLGHPEYFVRISECTCSEERLLAVLRWYLTSVHVGRHGSQAKKPYNPIIGETFQCSWLVPRSVLANKTPSNSSLPKKSDYIKIRFAAEQVSHHPPVSAFYFECPEKQLCINGHIWTKSKFMGMSVGVNLLGDITLTVGGIAEQPSKSQANSAAVNSNSLGSCSNFFVSNENSITDHINNSEALTKNLAVPSASEDNDIAQSYCFVDNDYLSSSENQSEGVRTNVTSNSSIAPSTRTETYSLGMPAAFARSILTEPWAELGGRVSIVCHESGYSAPVVFQTKPFYGGNLHRVSGELRSPNGEVLHRVAGEWDSRLEFTDCSGHSPPEVINVRSLPLVCHKRVRPLPDQGEGESRRLWQDVTTALQRGDLDTATAHKRRLEDMQRVYEAARRAKGEAYPGKLFRRVNGNSVECSGADHWLYRKLPSYATVVCGRPVSARSPRTDGT